MNYTVSELVKMAEEYGIKYTLNSNNPGFYVTKEDGTSQKIDLLDLFWLRDVPND